MLLAMVALGEVFGRFISPWTAMVLLLALAIYDFLAVRFGYMLWMVKKMSESTTLPAFIIPYKFSDWKGSLKKSDVNDLIEQKAEERKYSILGGGDIGFPVFIGFIGLFCTRFERWINCCGFCAGRFSKRIFYTSKVPERKCNAGVTADCGDVHNRAGINRPRPLI